MSFPKIDPSMLNNINPEQMKMASDMLSGMSDEQLKSYSKMMGMGDIDPSMLRSSAGMMKNMDRHQFETMKNTAQQHYSTNNNNTSTPTSSNTQSSQPSSTQDSVSRYSNIEALKLKGNNLFKKQSYDEASSAYFEAIIDIEEIRSKNVNDSDLDALEVSCRLNYANVKAKLNEYDTVMIQAKAVLKIQENGKAYFRLGQALSHFKKYEDAQKNLEKAVNLLPNDATVTELLQEVKSHIKVEEPKETAPEAKENSAEEESASKTQEEGKSKMKKKHAPDVEAPITKEEPKASKVEAPFDYLGNKKAEQTKEKETIIEEEKIPERKPVPTQAERAAPKEEIKTSFGNIGSDQVKKSQDELSKMNSDQLKSMTDTFKNMDNNTLRSILKAQSGMDLSDEQLTKMKAMMTPEMLQGFSKMNTANLPKGPGQQAPTTTAAPNRGNIPAQPSVDQSNQPLLGDLPGFPGNSMDLGSDQVQGMMDMVIQNPEMLKNLVGMLGENHPIAKMLQNKTPEQLAKYMKVIQKLLKFYGKISPLVKVLRDWWQLLAGLLIAYVIYRLTQ